MDPIFISHNSHLVSNEPYNISDPNLRHLSTEPYIHTPEIIQNITLNIPGIYTLCGGRQVGKTTTLKLIIDHLLKNKTKPNSIAFFTGELIDDHHSLITHLHNHTKQMTNDELRYILIDEITYIKNWDRAIKYAADSGLFEKTIVIISGSELMMIQNARMYFPGRRGNADKVDFHLHPLSFAEFLSLTNKKFYKTLLSKQQYLEKDIEYLYNKFSDYMIHGGYLTAINDYTKNKEISVSTLSTYSDWIRGDMIKQEKNDFYLKEILTAIIKCYGSQVTWNSLSHHMSIQHPSTISNYATILERMDALIIQSAIIEDKLIAAPKKAKKLMFKDPFIYHAIHSWINPTIDPFKQQIKLTLNNPITSSQIAESIAISHYTRYYPTYYIKAQSEVDIAYVNNNTFYPIEVKWQNSLNYKSLKQIKKYKNATILSKTNKIITSNEITEIPLPLALAKINKEL